MFSSLQGQLIHRFMLNIASLCIIRDPLNKFSHFVTSIACYKIETNFQFKLLLYIPHNFQNCITLFREFLSNIFLCIEKCVRWELADVRIKVS